jgi:hypothetical protein
VRELIGIFQQTGRGYLVLCHLLILGYNDLSFLRASWT